MAEGGSSPSERWDKHAEGYDLVIVDAPASGHGLGMLSTPRTFADIARVGPIAGQATRVREFLEDSRRSGYLAVALPGEMPVSETLELEKRLRKEFGRRVEKIVVNGVLSRRFASGRAGRSSTAPSRRPSAARSASSSFSSVLLPVKLTFSAASPPGRAWAPELMCLRRRGLRSAGSAGARGDLLRLPGLLLLPEHRPPRSGREPEAAPTSRQTSCMTLPSVSRFLKSHLGTRPPPLLREWQFFFFLTSTSLLLLPQRRAQPAGLHLRAPAPDGHFRYSGSSDQTPVWAPGQVLVAAATKTLPLTPPRPHPEAEVRQQFGLRLQPSGACRPRPLALGERLVRPHRLAPPQRKAALPPGNPHERAARPRLNLHLRASELRPPGERHSLRRNKPSPTVSSTPHPPPARDRPRRGRPGPGRHLVARPPPNW